MKTARIRYAGGIALCSLASLVAVTLMAKGPAKQQTVKPARATQKYGLATGADQVLTAVYDPSTNTLRVSGGGSGSGSVTSVGLSMPSPFNVTGSPVTSSGTLSVNWAQPVSIANGGTGQSSASAAFNALAPLTAAGGLVYGTGTNTYGSLTLGPSGQCLGSSGLTLVWTTCGAGTTITLGGDLSGTLTSQTVVGLQGHPVSASAPAGGQVLEWNSSANAWLPATLPASGTVSSVGLTVPSIFNVTGSPITGSGTLAVSLAGETSNTVLAGPSSGAAGAPAFRTLVGADIPAINLGASGNGGVSGTLSVAEGGTGLGAVGSNGQCLSSNGAAMIWQACGSGTVTSVGMTLPNGFVATGSPVTTSGALGISMPSGWGVGSLLVGNTTNSVATLPVGTSGQCLTSNGTTAIWGACATGGTSSTFQVNGASLTSQTTVNFQSGGYITVSNPSAGNIQFNFSGPLGVANGGTGLTTAGTSGQCLTSTGTAATWGACGSGALAIQTNGTNNLSQTSLNLANGTNIAFSNSSGGTVTASVTGTLPASDLPAINLASAGNGGVTGVLPFGNGGTGLSALGTALECLQTNSAVTAMQWGACGSGSAITLQTNGTNNLSQTALNLVAGTNITLTNTSLGNVTIAAASGSLPASWSVAPTTNTVTGEPAASQDATTLVLAPSLSTGGTADILDVCATAACAAKYMWVTYNGNFGFAGNTWQLGAASQATQSYLRMYGGSTPNAPAYVDLLNNTGTFRTTLSASVSVSGIACVGSTIPGGDCGPTIASSSYLVSAAGGTAPTTSDCAKWISSTQIGDAGAACGSGGGATFQVNATALTSSSTINWQSGGPITVTNVSAGNVQFTCPTCVVTNPAANQTIQAQSATVIPLVVKAAASQTADVFDVDNSAGSVLANVSPSGSFSADYIGSSSSVHATTAFVLDGAGSHYDMNKANSDVSGVIAISAALSASFTFASAYTSAPACVLTPTSNPGTLTWWVTTTATAVTANLSASGTLSFNYVCMGNPN